jgi:hypothetical protein
MAKKRKAKKKKVKRKGAAKKQKQTNRNVGHDPITYVPKIPT